MLVDWKYIYKRRNWTVQVIFNGLDPKTWEAFQVFHEVRGIQCPPKQRFDDALSSYNNSISPAEHTSVKEKAPVKRKRASTRKKGVPSDSAEKRKK